MIHKPKYGHVAQCLINMCQAVSQIEGASVALTFDSVVFIHRHLTDIEDDLFTWTDNGSGVHGITIKEKSS